MVYASLQISKFLKLNISLGKKILACLDLSISDCGRVSWMVQYFPLNHTGAHTRRNPMPSLILSSFDKPKAEEVVDSDSISQEPPLYSTITLFQNLSIPLHFRGSQTSPIDSLSFDQLPLLLHQNYLRAKYLIEFIISIGVIPARGGTSPACNSHSIAVK